MNKKIRTFVASIFAATLMLTLSCKGKTEAKEEQTEQTEQSEMTAKQGKEYTSAYVCPMHCEGSGSEEAGTCPSCGMAYVVNEDHKEDGHNHE